MQLIIQNSFCGGKAMAHAHNFVFSVFSPSSADLSDCVSVAGVTVEEPASQLRRCECDCQSGSCMMGRGIFLNIFSKPGFPYSL